MEDVLYSSTGLHAYEDSEKVEKHLKKYDNKKSSIVHTHPETIPYLGGIFGGSTPSPTDVKRLLDKEQVKTLIVGQQNRKTGEIGGYTFIKKTKKTKPWSSMDPIKEIGYEILRYFGPLSKFALKKMAKDHNLNYKFVPAKGYRLNKMNAFVKENDLESKVAASIIGISALTLCLIFLSPTFTGNAIATLTTKTSSIIGVGLFIVGIVGSYFYFRKS